MSSSRNLPPYDEFMNPVLTVLLTLGGSGTVEEIDAKVVELTNLSSDQLAVLHNPQRGSQTEIEYRLAWARTYLKKAGLIDNSSRGIWTLTVVGRDTQQVEPREVKRFVRDLSRVSRQHENEQENEISDPEIEAISWRDELISVLLSLEPDAFERLTQRMLREAGFIQVEVTGRTGDGGIDGKGIIRFGGLINFRVMFQCKRYRGTVGSPQVRDFRGAVIGRAERGLLITTGSFSKDAKQEATRDGALTIDLIDGEQLVDKLKELSLGLKTEMVEKVTVDRNWYQGI